MRFAQRAVNIKTEASVNVIQRMFESADQQSAESQRQTNASVARAVAEALEAQGGVGQLQARVLRELEAENKRLRSEVLLATGNTAKYSQNDTSGLEKALDKWVAGSGALPDLDNRADYVYSLEYLKKVVLRNRDSYQQELREQSKFDYSPPIVQTQDLSKPLQDDTKQDTPVKKAKTPEKRSESGSRQRATARSKNGKRDAKAKEDLPAEPTNPFGTVEDTGALSVNAFTENMTLAQSLRPRQAQTVLASSPTRQSNLASPTAGSASLTVSGAYLALEDENGRFDAFKLSNQGQQLVRDLQQ